MKLIYRATHFNFVPQSLPAYRHPQAINWRYRKFEPIESEITVRSSYRQPQAINWRYCPSA